ncbi:MAG: restriction endonuclease subunit S, partial [Acidobacteriaceae bacterium]|nr:restriction endonuclease subunit S [Acidobacteriaceae bacterium]
MRAGWQRKLLADVCVVDKRQGAHKQLPYVGLEHIESHTGRFIGSTDPVEVRSSTFKFSPQHLLFGRLRPYLNKVMAPDFAGHCSTEIFPIKPNRELSREFLQYWFLWEKTVSLIDATCTGARMPRANMNAVLNFEFLLPSIPEQQRIVRILDEAFDAITTIKANTEKNLQNARAVFESHLQAVFTQRGEGWVEKRLGEVCELFQGLCINSKTKHLLVANSSLPLLRIQDLRSGLAEQFVAESGWPQNAKVNESEIIYTRTGQIGLVFRGRVGVLHNNCFKVKPKSLLNEDYLFWWLQNPGFRNQIIALASKAAQPDITHALF